MPASALSGSMALVLYLRRTARAGTMPYLASASRIREGVEEADLGLVGAHGLDGGGEGGADFDLVGQAGHLGQAVGDGGAGLGDLAGVARGHEGDDDRLVRRAQLAGGRSSRALGSLSHFIGMGVLVGPAVGVTPVAATGAGVLVTAAALVPCIGRRLAPVAVCWRGGLVAGGGRLWRWARAAWWRSAWA